MTATEFVWNESFPSGWMDSMNSSVTEGQKKVNLQYFDDFWQLFWKDRLEMFAYISEGSKNLQITFFRLFVRGLVNAPQVFKYCVTEGT